MSLQDTVSAERIHIGFFGVRNAGKSSLVNAVTGQEISVVSEVRGTTTDPVRKAMELLPLGPVLIIDTPGIDDTGTLGEMRVKRARQILARTDLAVLVAEAGRALGRAEEELLALFRERGLPYVIAYNKTDLLPGGAPGDPAENEIYVSAKTGQNIRALREKLGAFAERAGNPRPLVADLIVPGGVAVLVVPIDAAAPKGRLILPQQQTMRDILDAHGTFITCQPEELSRTLGALRQRPCLVITDSQAFERVSRDTPEEIPLTSFSILFARYKGDLTALVRGAARLSELRDGDRVLIAEGCTHHRQCGDIGTEKLPAWIGRFTGAKPAYTFTSGNSFPEPEELAGFRLVVHCGGCMLNEREMKHRIGAAEAAGIPIVNYGVAIAHMHGILRRGLQLFPETAALLP